MSLASNVLSGYHFEIQFSEKYLELLIDKAFSAGMIPKQFVQDDISLKLNGLDYLKFIHQEGANVEISIIAEVTTETIRNFSFNVSAQIFIEITDKKLHFNYIRMTEAVKQALKGLNIPEIVIILIEQYLSDYIKGEFNFSGIFKESLYFKSKIITDCDKGCIPCFSLMVNANGIELGTLNEDSSKSFLLEDQEFSLGITAESIKKLIIPIRNKMSEYVSKHFEDDKLTKFSIVPNEAGKFKVDIFILGIWEGSDCLDPDIDINTTLSLNIKNGKISIKADDTDIEIGNWFTDVVVGIAGSIVGGLTGFLIGSLFGGPFVGAAIGGTIVGSAGLMGIPEMILGEIANDYAGQFLNSIYAIPYSLDMGNGMWLHHYFIDKYVDSIGIVMSGIQQRIIYNVTRDDSNKLNELILDDRKISPNDALSLTYEAKLKIHDLTIIAINKNKTRIENFKFENDVVLSVDETIEWQLKGLWNVTNAKLIIPKNGRRYYRTIAGDEKNLDNYPTFKIKQ